MKIISVVVCMLFLSICTQAQSADPKMTKAEREQLIQALLDSQKETLTMVENLTYEQWNFKPSILKWSVGQCVEHIALAEGLLFGAVQRALAAPVNPEWETKTANKEIILENQLAGRMGRARAPEPIQPMKKAMTRAEVMKLLKEGRENTLKFARETNADMKSHTFDNPFPIFGTLTAYQWALYIPMHNLRHNKQIAEVKANPNFPKATK